MSIEDLTGNMSRSSQNRKERIRHRRVLFVARIILQTIILGIVFYLCMQLIGFFTLFLPVKEIPVDEVERIIEETVQVNSISDSDTFENSEKVLLIPKIGAKLGIFDRGEDDLTRGIWHKFPERSNPLLGGNFILTGHRFSVGFNPLGQRRSSPLFNVNKLSEGDEVIVIWRAEVFRYTITEIFEVEPDGVWIETDTQEHILTLYTCGLVGRHGDRVVVRATLSN